MDFILEKAQEIEQIKNELSKEISNDKTTLQILDQLRENRMKNQEIPDELTKMVYYAEKLKGEHFINKIPLNLSFKIERFLLDPLIIPILENKIKNTR